ncbi:MAG: GNAT family N-acetyltransferase [Bacteroidales bacterium]|nr:GNAT family N-acetyltransferase [Bacteroidales bacterium]
MEIKHVVRDGGGYWETISDGKGIGLMSYVNADNKFIIDHTEVDDAFSGRGIGKNMVMEAVKYARDNDLKIIPLCPFAKGVFAKVPEIGDVLF